MKKEWLFLIILFLSGTGFLIFGLSRGHHQDPISSPNQVNRIVCLAPNLTEILFALGLGEKVVAVSNDSDHPPEAITKNNVGTFWQPNIEAIIASEPDLVTTLCFEQHKSIADSLKRLGYKVLTLKIEKIEELFSAIQKIGTATGCEQRAEQLVKSIREKLENLQMKLGSTKKVKVLCVVQTEPLRVAGRDTFVNELIELAGGENAIGPTIHKYPPISTEELLACEPQAIIQSAMSTNDLLAQQKAAEKFWRRYPTLHAVKNNRIYVVEADTILRLGPRLPQGLKLIAQCLYPHIQKQEMISQKDK